MKYIHIHLYTRRNLEIEMLFVKLIHSYFYGLNKSIGLC